MKSGRQDSETAFLKIVKLLWCVADQEHLYLRFKYNFNIFLDLMQFLNCLKLWPS